MPSIGREADSTAAAAGGASPPGAIPGAQCAVLTARTVASPHIPDLAFRLLALLAGQEANYRTGLTPPLSRGDMAHMIGRSLRAIDAALAQLAAGDALQVPEPNGWRRRRVFDVRDRAGTRDVFVMIPVRLLREAVSDGAIRLYAWLQLLAREGHRAPTVDDLADRWGVSAATVKRARRELVRVGAQPARGSFAAHRRGSPAADRGGSFAADLYSDPVIRTEDQNQDPLRGPRAQTTAAPTTADVVTLRPLGYEPNELPGYRHRRDVALKWARDFCIRYRVHHPPPAGDVEALAAWRADARELAIAEGERLFHGEAGDLGAKFDRVVGDYMPGQLPLALIGPVPPARSAPIDAEEPPPVDPPIGPGPLLALFDERLAALYDLPAPGRHSRRDRELAADVAARYDPDDVRWGLVEFFRDRYAQERAHPFALFAGSQVGQWIARGRATRLRVVGPCSFADVDSPRRDSLPAHLDRVIARLTAMPARGRSAAFDHRLDDAVRELDRTRAAAQDARGEARAGILDRLGALDRELLNAARSAIDDTRRRALDAEAESDIAPFAARMTPEARAVAIAAAFDRLLRDREGLPVCAANL